jgi:hypothetical protein
MRQSLRHLARPDCRWCCPKCRRFPDRRPRRHSSHHLRRFRVAGAIPAARRGPAVRPSQTEDYSTAGLPRVVGKSCFVTGVMPFHGCGTSRRFRDREIGERPAANGVAEVRLPDALFAGVAAIRSQTPQGSANHSQPAVDSPTLTERRFRRWPRTENMVRAPAIARKCAPPHIALATLAPFRLLWPHKDAAVFGEHFACPYHSSATRATRRLVRGDDKQ